MPICTSGTSLVRNLVRDTTLSDALDIHLVYIFVFSLLRLGWEKLSKQQDTPHIWRRLHLPVFVGSLSRIMSGNGLFGHFLNGIS